MNECNFKEKKAPLLGVPGRISIKMTKTKIVFRVQFIILVYVGIFNVTLIIPYFLQLLPKLNLTAN